MEQLLKKIKKDPLAIKRVNLSINAGEIPAELEGCTNLEALDFSFSDVRRIPAFVAKLPKLNSLGFAGCEGLKFPNNLASYPSLRELAISTEKGKELPTVFALTELTKLTIHGNIKEIPDDLANLENLKELDFFAIPLPKLPRALGQLPNLQKLTINTAGENLDMKQAMAVLGQCKKLAYLTLKTQNLTLGPSIGQLKSLKSLNLSGNYLSSVPEALYDLEHLTELDLGLNNLKEIPRGIGKLKKLRILKLNSNHSNSLDVTNLMNEIHLLENLKVLHLWSCQSVRKLPESIAACKKLEELDVDNNLLEDVPDALLGMTWLKKLRLTTNKIPIPAQDRIVAALPNTKVSVDGKWHKK